MDTSVKNPWEIDDLFPKIDSDLTSLIKEFTIHSESKVLQNSAQIKKIKDMINIIENSEKNKRTDIGISYLKKNGPLMFILIMDENIFIINQISIQKLTNYFKENLKSLIFLTKEIKEYIEFIISGNFPNSEQTDHFFNDQQNQDTKPEDEIIRFILKKSQYRTLKMRQEQKKIDTETFNNYVKNDFIPIQKNRVYYNRKDQKLYFLKTFNHIIFKEQEKELNHEIDFYRQIKNSFPFICKMFGLIKDYDNYIIVLEYIEGETLELFIEKHKEIDFSIKFISIFI